MRNGCNKMIMSVLAMLVAVSMLPCGAFAEQDNLKTRTEKRRATIAQKKAAAEARKKKQFNRGPVTEQGGPVRKAPNGHNNK